MKRQNLLTSLLLLLLLQVGAWAKPWVVAHRGGAALGPENTLPTFQRAVELGVDAIELDIHQSADGGLMVIHDDTLKRTFGVDLRVDATTTAELRKHGVPTLSEAIELVDGRCLLIVEIKHPKKKRHKGIERRLLKTLKEYDVISKTIVISFDKKSLRLLRELSPELQTGWLFATPPLALEKTVKDLGVSYLGPHFLLATPSLIERAHRLELKVNAWTVNDENAMRLLTERGIDAITSDRPDLLIDSLIHDK